MSSPRPTRPARVPAHSVETSEEAGVRYLHFGSEWVQGAMRIARPYALELEYTREMMACLLLRPEPDWPASVLQVGLGAASLAKFWLRHRHVAHQTILEINPAVVTMAHQSFKLPREAPGIEIEIADAVAWMQGTRRARYDCLMVDGYDHNARFGALGSTPFYADCRRHLSRRGLLVLNLFGRSRGFARQVSGLREVFAGRVLALEPIEGGNAIALAWTGESPQLDPVRWKEHAMQLRVETGLNLMATVTRMVRALPGVEP